MCKDCGCGKADHSHQAHTHGTTMMPRRIVRIEQKVLAQNDDRAAQNRAEFKRLGVFAPNLISSPGAGKTMLLERTLEALRGEILCAVITGDQRTERDAERLRGKGAAVVQIETGNTCHLDAERVAAELPAVLNPVPKILFIENIGNLICPAAFDLGEDIKIALLSVTEGEDKPLKYPTAFSQAQVILLTKVDLIAHLDWDLGRCLEYLHQVNPTAKVIQVSARSGKGMAEWLQFLRGACN